MKEDKLKDFISDNKEGFESEFPSDNLWQKIENELEGRKETKIISFQRFLPYVAAAAVVILGMFFFLNSDGEQIIADQTEDIQNNLVADFGEVEGYYMVQVNDRLKSLKSYDVDPELLEEVDDLKQEFEELKIEMGLGADPGMVLEAMIENYRLRLEILEDLSRAFEASKQKREEHEIIQ